MVGKVIVITIIIIMITIIIIKVCTTDEVEECTVEPVESCKQEPMEKCNTVQTEVGLLICSMLTWFWRKNFLKIIVGLQVCSPVEREECNDVTEEKCRQVFISFLALTL